MEALVCKVCASNSVHKEDEYYVCDYCGTKYPERMKYDITGEVSVNGIDSFETLMKKGDTYLKFEDYQNATDVFGEVVSKYPSEVMGYAKYIISWTGNFYASLSREFIYYYPADAYRSRAYCKEKYFSGDLETKQVSSEFLNTLDKNTMCYYIFRFWNKPPYTSYRFIFQEKAIKEYYNRMLILLKDEKRDFNSFCSKTVEYIKLLELMDSLRNLLEERINIIKELDYAKNQGLPECDESISSLRKKIYKYNSELNFLDKLSMNAEEKKNREKNIQILKSVEEKKKDILDTINDKEQKLLEIDQKASKFRIDIVESSSKLKNMNYNL